MVTLDLKTKDVSGLRLLARLAAQSTSWNSCSMGDDSSQEGVRVPERKRDVKAASKLYNNEEAENFRENDEHGPKTA